MGGYGEEEGGAAGAGGVEETYYVVILISKCCVLGRPGCEYPRTAELRMYRRLGAPPPPPPPPPAPRDGPHGATAGQGGLAQPGGTSRASRADLSSTRTLPGRLEMGSVP